MIDCVDRKETMEMTGESSVEAVNLRLVAAHSQGNRIWKRSFKILQMLNGNLHVVQD